MTESDPTRTVSGCSWVFGPYNCAKVAGHEGEHIGAQAGGWQLTAGVAAGPQATPQVLWEGDLGELMHAVNGTLIMSALVDAFPADEPGQWQVRVQRVVAAPTSQENDHG